jgi:hypothetical protein
LPRSWHEHLKELLKKWLGREIGSIVNEAICNFFWVIVLTVLAVLFGLIRQWCEKMKFPDEVLFFVRFLEYASMGSDGILFVATCAILTWKRIKKLTK